MTFTVPLQYLGEGEFRSTSGHARRCDKMLVIGETLTWEEIKLRSMKSHDHFFVCVNESWKNLPEAVAMEYPSSEHMRKRALIKAGYCTQTHIVCRDHHSAIQASALMLGLDEYLMIEIVGLVVTVWKAESQSLKSMGAKKFQKSKDDCLSMISDIAGFDASKAQEAA